MKISNEKLSKFTKFTNLLNLTKITFEKKRKTKLNSVVYIQMED